jgi:VWFA-related protein
MRKLVCLVLAAALAGGGYVLAQADEETILRVDVDLVNIFFSVRDKKGTLIADLNRDETQVFEDGKQQEIRHFTRESDLPLTIGLLVDVSRSQENLIEVEKHAAGEFFTQVLRPKDMAFAIAFGTDAELLQDSTNSVPLLKRSLDSLKVSAAPYAGVFGNPGPVPTASQPRGTILYDAVYLAAQEKLRHEVGRKAIIVITDGIDMGSRISLREAIEAAQKSDAIIYSIQYIDPGAYGYFGVSDGDLKKMSEETGGRMFRVGRKDTLGEIFDQIQNEMRTQYALAYSPTNAKKDGGFRKLEIKTTRKDLKVQARKGYFASASVR